MEPIRNIWDWIREDWKSHPARFVVESLCWLDSMICAVIVNITVPELPFLLLYPLWISGTLAYAWCAYSRQSFGMLTTFIMIATMDLMGYIKILIR
jgi:hypothetical protein